MNAWEWGAIGVLAYFVIVALALLWVHAATHKNPD